MAQEMNQNQEETVMNEKKETVKNILIHTAEIAGGFIIGGIVGWFGKKRSYDHFNSGFTNVPTDEEEPEDQDESETEEETEE